MTNWPGLTVVTSLPTSSTNPTYSWPIGCGSPTGSTPVGPQIGAAHQAATVRMIASVGAVIFGSGAFSTRMSPGAWMTRAAHGRASFCRGSLCGGRGSERAARPRPSHVSASTKLRKIRPGKGTSWGSKSSPLPVAIGVDAGKHDRQRPPRRAGRIPQEAPLGASPRTVGPPESGPAPPRRRTAPRGGRPARQHQHRLLHPPRTGPHAGSAPVLDILARVPDWTTTSAATSSSSRARPPPAPRRSSRQKVQPELQRVLYDLTATPAIVQGRRGDILAWNAPAVALVTDFSHVPESTATPGSSSPIRPCAPVRRPGHIAHISVAELRMEAAKYPEDPPDRAGRWSPCGQAVRPVVGRSPCRRPHGGHEDPQRSGRRRTRPGLGPHRQHRPRPEPHRLDRRARLPHPRAAAHPLVLGRRPDPPYSSPRT